MIHPVCETIKEKSVKEAVEMIEAAKTAICSSLVADVHYPMPVKSVREFVKKVDAPVCDTLMGKGAFSRSRIQHYTGMLGNAWNEDFEYRGIPMQTYSLQSVHDFSDRVIW